MQVRTHPDYVSIFLAAHTLFVSAPCNGALARDSRRDFRSVDPTSPKATHFDPIGAIIRSAGNEVDAKKCRHFANKYALPTGGWRDVSHWADQPKRKLEDVYQWFQVLISQAQTYKPGPETVVGMKMSLAIPEPEPTVTH